MVDEETRALLALRLVPGLGPRLTRALVEHFGSARAILQARAEQLSQVRRLPQKVAAALARAIVEAPLEQELADVTDVGARIVPWHSADYPQLLRQLPDAPPILYMRGVLLPNEPCIAVVGSRLCTNYGRRITERLVAGLVQAGYTIVSGLARGIDAIAHRTALANSGRTVAVFAGGLLCVYPPEHRDLAEEIAQHGALLSEQPMRMPPERTMFPARNRLISGLCQGVVIVEAGERSGALITARHAVEQGREVFVVPGPVDSPTAGGIVHLLRQGAYAVRNATEIIAVLRGERGEQSTPHSTPLRRSKVGSAGPSASPFLSSAAGYPVFSAEPSHADPSGAASESLVANAQSAQTPSAGCCEPRRAVIWSAGTPDYVRKLYEALGYDPQDADFLAEQTGLSAQDLARAVVQLELQGLLRRLPGNRLARRD